MKWFQLYVKSPTGKTAKEMKEVDDFLVKIAPAAFVAPDGLPVQNGDGTWEVRVFLESALSFVKHVLTQIYDLEIVNEVTNEK